MENQTKAIFNKEDSNTIRVYFQKILELKNTGENFPVNLDSVFPLVYSEKGKAVRALKDNFIENEDYIVFSQNGKNLKGGRTTIDYKLSVSCLEYFIAKKVREVFEVYRAVFHQAIQPKVMSIEELIIAQAQSMIDAKKDIAEVKQEVLEVKSKLAQIEESRNIATEQLLLAERSKEKLPEETTRVKIRRLVNQYCNAKNADQQSVWRVVYDRLYYRYGVSLRAVVRKNNENMLDVAERLGHLDKIFTICSNELV